MDLVKTRLHNFDKNRQHPWFNKLYNRLTVTDENTIINFIKQSGDLDANQYEFKLNRLFLDKEKPKNWKIILELIMISK